MLGRGAGGQGDDTTGSLGPTQGARHEGMIRPKIDDANRGAVVDLGQSDIPLCVDLDGTLIQTDLLVQGLVAVRTNRRQFGRLPPLLAGSRAGLKRQVAAFGRIEVSQAYPFVGLGFVLTTMLGYLLFGDVLGPQRILGMLLVVGSIVMVAWS